MNDSLYDRFMTLYLRLQAMGHTTHQGYGLYHANLSLPVHQWEPDAMPDFTYMNNRIDNVFTLPLQGVDYGLPGVFYVMLHTNEVEAVSEAGTIIRGYDSNQLRIAINAFLTYNNA